MFMRSSFCLVSVFWGVRVCYLENCSRTLWDFDTWTNLIWWLTFTDDNSILGWEASSMCLCWHNPMASSIFSLATPFLPPSVLCLSISVWWQIGGQLFCVHFIMVCFDGCERLFSILNLIWFSAFQYSHSKWSKIIELFESVWNENSRCSHIIPVVCIKQTWSWHTNAKVRWNYAFICIRPYHHVPQSLLSICRTGSVCQVSN